MQGYTEHDIEDASLDVLGSLSQHQGAESYGIPRLILGDRLQGVPTTMTKATCNLIT